MDTNTTRGNLQRPDTSAGAAPVTSDVALASRAKAANPSIDERILDAFTKRRQEFAATYDVNMSQADENAYFARADAYERVIQETQAETIAGAVVKLRIAFKEMVGKFWSDHAILNPATPVFIDGLESADQSARLAWGAIEDLARIGGIDLSEQGA